MKHLLGWPSKDTVVASPDTIGEMARLLEINLPISPGRGQYFTTVFNDVSPEQHRKTSCPLDAHPLLSGYKVRPPFTIAKLTQGTSLTRVVDFPKTSQDLHIFVDFFEATNSLFSLAIPNTDSSPRCCAAWSNCSRNPREDAGGWWSGAGSERWPWSSQTWDAGWGEILS